MELESVHPLIGNVNVTEVPLFALRDRTRNALSRMLNRKKLISTPEELLRDWRGLAQLAKLDAIEGENPTEILLRQWERQEPFPKVEALLTNLVKIDRWDVLDDCAGLIEEDLNEYIQRKEAGIVDTRLRCLDHDKQIITLDDTYRFECGLGPQFYDAFLLHADEDFDKAKKIVDELEQRYNLKICLRDRDLVGGLSFEHEAIKRLIAERCNRLIIILSPFLFSKWNQFYLCYGEYLGIEQQKRKIIPCTFGKIQRPPELSYYSILDLSSPFGNTWDRLRMSIVDQTDSPSSRSVCTIREITSSEEAVALKLNDSSVTTFRESELAKSKVEKGDSLVPKERKKGPSLTFLRKIFPDSPNTPIGESGSKKKITWLKKKKKKNEMVVAS